MSHITFVGSIIIGVPLASFYRLYSGRDGQTEEVSRTSLTFPTERLEGLTNTIFSAPDYFR